MDKSNLLIDFNSPAQKKDLKPLIPVPPQTSALVPKEIDEPSVDPFEVQDMEASDPFDGVLQRALHTGSSDTGGEPTAGADAQISDGKSQIHIKSEAQDSTKTLCVENLEKIIETVSSSLHDNVLNKKPLETDQVSSRNEIPEDCKLDLKNSQNITVVKINAQDSLINSPKVLVAIESGNQSQLSADMSTEEGLKAVIAKRVNRCIQEALNGSLNQNKNRSNSVFKKPQNKRSLSFIGLSTVLDGKKCDRLNKSCTEVKDTFNCETQKHDASSDSSGFGLLTPSSTDVSMEGDVEDQVFKEARKLSRTFSKLAESFRQDSDSDDDDLMSCKPRWMYTDSSEDEEEKLLKDPALNIRRRGDSSTPSSPALQPPKLNDSPALLAYKSRRSTSHLQAHNNTQEEPKMTRSISMSSQPREAPVIPTIVATVPINLMQSDDQPIKLRKKNVGEMKKGPLRAVMPIQSMTKEPLPISSKLPPKQDISPESRLQKPVGIVGTPNKDNSQLNITPMASSTPNKAESFASSSGIASLLRKPVAPVLANKRHSLEGSVGSHKSREVVSEGGARPRSNSANSSSSIPRVMYVKPLRGLPLAPKSASNLASAANTQMNTNKVHNVPEKKNSSHLKSRINTRVLTDVKTKSPRQSKVRAAVNTISNLVRGKKTAARDKENRVPS